MSRYKDDYEKLRNLSAEVGNLRKGGVPEEAAMKNVDGFQYQGELMAAKAKAFERYMPEFSVEQKKREDANKISMREEQEAARQMGGRTQGSSMQII